MAQYGAYNVVRGVFRRNISAEALSLDFALRGPLHVRFGAFTLDSRQRRIERDGVAIERAPKQFDTLLC